jgi:hypothetical protein
MTLEVGDEAWHVVQSAATPSGRRHLLGAARVRIAALPGVRGGVERSTHQVEVLRATGAAVGARIECLRRDLYDPRDPEEHAAFAVEVRRFWEAA